MSSADAAVVIAAVVTVVGVVSAALMSGIFSRGTARDDRTIRHEQLRDALIDNLQEEVVRLRAQVVALESKVAEAEGRPHRSIP